MVSAFLPMVLVLLAAWLDFEMWLFFFFFAVTLYPGKQNLKVQVENLKGLKPQRFALGRLVFWRTPASCGRGSSEQSW